MKTETDIRRLDIETENLRSWQTKRRMPMNNLNSYKNSIVSYKGVTH